MVKLAQTLPILTNGVCWVTMETWDTVLTVESGGVVLTLVTYAHSLDTRAAFVTLTAGVTVLARVAQVTETLVVWGGRTLAMYAVIVTSVNI